MRKSSKKIMTAITAGVCAVVLIGVGVLTPWYNASAKDTLQGIQEIVNNSSKEAPYRILEIVPDVAAADFGNDVKIEQSMGSIGYYIGGQEPVRLEWDLAQFNDSSKRKEFVDKLYSYDTVTSTGSGALVDITEYVDANGTSSGATPLYFKDYIEKYESDYATDELTAGLADGSIRQIDYAGYLKAKQDEELAQLAAAGAGGTGGTGTQEIPEISWVDQSSDASMTAISDPETETGNFVINYLAAVLEEGSTNPDTDPARLFFAGNMTAGSIIKNSTSIEDSGTGNYHYQGQFDPHVQANSDGSATYAALFSAVKSTNLDRGYVPTRQEIPEDSKQWGTELNGKPVYKVMTDTDGKEYYEYYGYIKIDSTDANNNEIVALNGQLRGMRMNAAALASTTPTGTPEASGIPNASATPGENYDPLAPTATPTLIPGTTPNATAEASPSASAGTSSSAQPTSASGATPATVPTTEPSAETPTQAPEQNPTPEPVTPTEEPVTPTQAPVEQPSSLPPEGSFRELTAIDEPKSATETPTPLATPAKTGTDTDSDANSGEQATPTSAGTATEAPLTSTTPNTSPLATGGVATSPEVQATGTPSVSTSPNTSTSPSTSASPSTSTTPSPETVLLAMRGLRSLQDTSGNTLCLLTFEYQVTDLEAEGATKPDYYYYVRKFGDPGNTADTDEIHNIAKEYSINSDTPLVANPLGQGVVEVDESTANDIANNGTGEPLVAYEFSRGVGRFNGSFHLGSGTGGTVYLLNPAIYYEGGFRNNEWFKQSVFDRNPGQECEALHIEVETISAAELTTEDIAKADFIYLSNSKGELLPYGVGSTAPNPVTTYTGYGDSETVTVNGTAETIVHDMSAVRVFDILRQVSESKKPVLFEASLLKDAAKFEADDEPAKVSNVHRLAKLLTLNDLDTFYGAYASVSEETVLSAALISEYTNGSYTTGVADLFNTDSAVVKPDVIHFVNENKYCFDFNRNQYDTSTGEVDGDAPFGSNIMNLAFGNQFDFSSDVIKNNFLEVLTDIDNENLLRETDGGRTPIPTTVSEATTIRYIINFAKKKVQANKAIINVLEIQPCAAFDLSCSNIAVTDPQDSSKTVIEGKLVYKLGDSKEKTVINQLGTTINITRMTTVELIGKNEDLNAEYDLIYIGLNTGLMHRTWDDITQKFYTDYNDDSMDGMVYTNVGDTVQARIELAGLLDSDYIDGNRANNLIDKNGTYRFPGNDINAETREKLEDYVRAGYPILVEDEILNVDATTRKRTPNAAVLDNSSYMYDFFVNVTEPDKDIFPNASSDLLNVIQVSNSTQQLFNWYLNLSKPQLTLSGMARDAQDAQVKLSKLGDGYYHLDYNFSLTNTSAADNSSTFDCNLYIDINADGKFSKTMEEIEDVVIYNSVGEVQYPTDGHYSLATGQDYMLSKTVSNEYAGIIPWNIEVIQNGNSSRRTNQSGYYVIQKSERERINILQIYSPRLNTLILEDSMKNPSSLFYKYIKDVPDFDVQFTSIDSNEYKTQYDLNHKYLEQFDMVILGFADCYKEAPNDTGAMTAIGDYIKTGKSILFTHDTTSFVNAPYDKYGGAFGETYWGYSFNTLIRDKVGLDRYGVLSGSSENKEIAYKPGSNRQERVPEIQGITYGNIGRFSSHAMLANMDTGLQQYNNNYVSQVNQGQITMYPYKIDATMRVAKTHQQYYQIDLEADDDQDGESDIVVWYTLSGQKPYTGNEANSEFADTNDAYFKSPNDVRNNYYIFNKGNVTYAGVGHANIDTPGNDGEVKLFVNTMIAAYKAGLRAPKVSILENKEFASRRINNLYLSYDSKLKDYRLSNGVAEDDVNEGIVEEKHDIFFATESVNLVEGNQTMSVKYYIEDTAGTKTLVVDEAEVKVREVTSLCPLLAADTLAPVDVNSIESGKVYQFSVPTGLLNMDGKNRVRIFVEVTATLQLAHMSEPQEVSSVSSVAMVRTQMFDLN